MPVIALSCCCCKEEIGRNKLKCHTTWAEKAERVTNDTKKRVKKCKTKQNRA